MDELNPLKQTAYPSTSTHAMDVLQAELKEQRKLIEENHAMLKSLRRSLRLSTLFSFIRILIVVIPLILLALYLPPLIKNWLQTFDQYQQALNGNGSMPQGFDIKQIQELLQKSGMLER